MPRFSRATLAVLLSLIAVGTAEAAAPWVKETRDGDPFTVARQKDLALAIGCDDGTLVMTYAVPKTALAAELKGLPKVYLVLDYDGAGTGVYYFYETRLTDGGDVWLATPIEDALADNVRMLAAARKDIRVGLMAEEPSLTYTLQHEAWVTSKGSRAAVKPAMAACKVPLK